MKINTPVTGVERVFGEGENIISTTNPKGAITSYNEVFYRISGFDHDELRNKNHNVVRHPEMPPAAFEDLWKTLQEGRSWLGIVKNRCKNGDHYWVDAYVTPIRDSAGRVVEYQSVRVQPRPEHQARAEKLYKDLLANKRGLPRGGMGLNVKYTAAIMAPMLLGMGVAWLSGFLVAGMAVGMPAAVVMGGWLARPLRALASETKHVIDNDIARWVYGGRLDELGQIRLAMHMYGSELNSVVARLSQSSAELAGVADGTVQAVHQANEDVGKQQDEIHQLVTAMNEMSATVQEVARNTSDAAGAAQRAQHSARVGKKEMDNSVSMVRAVADQVKQAEQTVHTLRQESEQIRAVLDVIRGVAEQTNLLALNAAIEAARAGDQGRGFAVVAGEVRALAQRTHESTQEIRAMIERIQNGTQDAVRAMESGCSQVAGSVQQAERAGAVFDGFSEEVATIADMNTRVAAAAEEQSMVAEEINRNVVNISQASQRNASLCRETEQSMAKLSGFADDLRRLVDQFRERRAQGGDSN